MAKNSGSNASNNKKSKKKSGPNAQPMKLKAPKPNPFETIWSRRKFDILGVKRKGEERRVGLARSRAIEKRKKTLLKEYEQSGKASVFIDKRIGEQDDALGEFDKAIIRSQRERQLKLGKKSKYNLSDGEEDEFEIEGAGSLLGRDDFRDEMLSDDDNDDSGEADENDKKSNLLKQLNAHNVQNLAEGGSTEAEENRHKSKKEVMEEIILKSKFFKAQKAKEKGENEQLMEDLDKSFTSLVQSQALLSLTKPQKMNALRALVNKGIPDEHVKKDEVSVSLREETFELEKPDSYDKLVREMVVDIRAHPSERTKTPEEIAQEERERLEQLEEERQKRMLAADDSSDEENEGVEKSSAQKLRSISGDDLGDSFSLEEEPARKKGWVDEILERRDEENSESENDDSSGDSEGAEDDDDNDNEGSYGDNDEHERNISLKDWEQSDDDNLSTDLDEDEEHDDDADDGKEQMEPIGNQKANNSISDGIKKKDGVSLDGQKIKENADKLSTQPDIPYLIEAPNSLEQFCALVDNCSNANIIEVIKRIKAGNAIKLAAENRKKIQVFYGVLLQYFAVLSNKKPLNFELLNMLVRPLMEMSIEIPYFAAICARQRILRTRTQFCEAIKNQDRGSWPTLKTLFLLRLWSMIFPCSDFRHVVMTPAILLMCEYLMRCPILSGRDIAVGVFLCSMVLSVLELGCWSESPPPVHPLQQVTKQSHKFCPEAIMFLRTVLMATADKRPLSNQDSEFYHLMELKSLGSLLRICNNVNEIDPLNFLTVMDMPDDSPFFSSDNFRASVLVTVNETLRGFVETYEGLSSFPELFSPFSVLLLEVSQQQNMPDTLQDKFRDVAQLINKKADECQLLRRPLQMRKKKPVPIKLLNPKFEENFVKGRDYDPDRERAERRKVQKLVKREAKGAARELRRDNYFIMNVKQKEKEQLEEEKAEKYGKAKAFLQDQQHAFRSGQLGKGRKRRR